MDYKYLNKISSPSDIKKLSTEELNILCSEIRDCLINTLSKTGGHLASNLGVVELTVALHKAFDLPEDKLLFDVGHQCYTHKLLTGRFDRFSTLRQKDGLSGFMRPDESEYDPFITGHSSTSVSAALGINKGTFISSGKENFTISVVGDGAMTGGMIYEGINNAGHSKNNSTIIILNDNKMSISRNVGALARHLTVVRSRPGYHRFKHKLERFIAHIPFVGHFINRNLMRSKTMLKNAIYHSNIFEDMGFHYLGPVDGHDLTKLQQILAVAKEQNRPVLIHVITRKGKGYTPAEKAPNNFHGVSGFNIEDGKVPSKKADFSSVVGDELCRLAASDEKLCVITAAMKEGTGLSDFADKYKNRFFDVGIAEEHAVTFTGGLAAGGAHPVFCVYSTFLQRAYDQLIHDVAIAKLPLTICVDRAGIVGDDGETHQGVFDIAFLKTIPGMQIFSPVNYLELKMFLNESIYNINGPSVVRYPRGSQPCLPEDFVASLDDYQFYGDPTSKSVIITFGRVFANAVECYENLKKENLKIAVLKLNKIYPINAKIYNDLKRYNKIYIFEEGILTGGINETLCAGILKHNISAKVIVKAIEDEFVPHMSIDSALEKYNLSAEAIYKIVKEEENEG